MKKIICVALNPAMDKTICIDEFDEGCVNPIEEVTYQIGGRGVNVAKVLNHFEYKTIVTGFVGGVWTDQFRTKLMKSGIETKFFKLIHDTRTNTKLIDRHTGKCTSLHEKGPFVPEEMVERFIQSLTIMCKPGDIVILTGGIPPGVPDDIYETLVRIAKDKGAYVILEGKGALLKNGLNAKPDAIKINFRSFLPKEQWEEMSDDAYYELVDYVKTLDIPKVLVSLGKKGALLLEEGKAYYAPSIDVPVELKHPIAAGDAMVAALVMSYIEEFDSEDTLKYAVACGAACVVSKDTKGCNPMQVNELLPKVNVTKIE